MKPTKEQKKFLRKCKKLLDKRRKKSGMCEHVEDLRCGRCGNKKIGLQSNCWYCGHNWFVPRNKLKGSENE